MIDAKITLTTEEGENRQFVAQSGSGHAVVIDDKHGNTGCRPIELVLMGLGGCTAFDVISILRKKRQKINSYQVLLSAEQKGEPPSIFTHVNVKHILRGTEIAPKAVEDAIRLSETKYCSVAAMISKTAQIDVQYEIRNDQGDLVATSEPTNVPVFHGAL
ncbi:MAG TPA: OsmC family protein [Terriglobia bacterium]|nr:OsmC family protein [Terriglobia bacterium]